MSKVSRSEVPPAGAPDLGNNNDNGGTKISSNIGTVNATETGAGGREAYKPNRKPRINHEVKKFCGETVKMNDNVFQMHIERETRKVNSLIRRRHYVYTHLPHTRVISSP